MSFVSWLDERSSDFDEVLEVTVGLPGSSWSSSLGFVLSDDVSEEFSPSIVGNLLSSWEVSLFVGDGLVEETLDLVL